MIFSNLIIFVGVIIQVTSGLKILGFFPVPGRSHYILGSSLMKGLAVKGHDVTVISPFGEAKPLKNYKDVILTGLLEYYNKQAVSMGSPFSRTDANPLLVIPFMQVFTGNMMEEVLKNENLQNFLKAEQKFDLVIVEHFFNDAHKAMAQHFGAPLVIFHSIGANSWINHNVGNPSPLSYIPETILAYSSNMTFFQRVFNTIGHTWYIAVNNWYSHCKQNNMIKTYFPNGPNLEDVIYNVSLVLLNSHPSIYQPVPYVPNMIEIGGFHVQPPKKLPQDLQDFLDTAADGVIYFSMGSNLKSAQFPAAVRNVFLKTFSKLKQKVLWKWEEDTLPGQPPNVKLSKWLPQQDILAHPNVRLFITHGGLLSTTETIYHGVPTLAIPVYGDQKYNARIAVNNGYGLMLPYQDITEENLTNKIFEVLNNPR